MRRRLSFLAGAWFLIAPAHALDDLPGDLPSYLAAQGYKTLPLETLDQNRQLLPAKINGQEVRLIVDTGCEHTELDRDRAFELKLHVRETNMYGMSVGGRIHGSVGIAFLKSFTIGGDEINGGQSIHILPKLSVIDPKCDGLFGYDLMHPNAFIIPVGAKSLWYKTTGAPADGLDRYLLSLGYRPTALDYGKAGLQLQSHLNGQPMNVVVDCGAPHTAFNADYVTKKCGLEIKPLPFTIHGVDGRQTKGFYFTTRDLFFGTMRVRPTQFTACRAPIFEYSKFDVLLGYDFLAAHQAVIDLGQNVIWMR